MNVDINEVIAVAILGGDEIMKIYNQDFEVFEKEDASPLTMADKNANDIIIKNLTELFPDIPYISEEVKQTDYKERKDWEYCWMIDPLDGTKEFIKRNGEFTVNIALIHNNEPILGVVYVPVTDDIYIGGKGNGAFKINADGDVDPLMKVENTTNLIKVIASRSHLSDEVVAFVEDLKKKGKEVEFISAGSSLKFCLIAEGKADIYPRLAPTMEWDTAAAHIVCSEAGFKVLNYDSQNEELKYNKENLLNPWFIVQ
jgi:3'(2'), 5'-bisphosphate nucleotidase